MNHAEEWIAYLPIILLILLGVQVALRLLSTQPRYKRITALFTPAETRLLHVLVDALPAEILIFGKVRVADVLKPRTSLSSREWKRQFWKICSKHFDYVLTDRETTNILCAIELDDRSHNRADRIRRDRFLDAACRSAELPLIRIPVRKQYDPRMIRHLVYNALQPDGKKKETKHISNPSPQQKHGLCPKCGSRLVLRTSGTNDRHFLGCSRFPDCRHTQSFS